MPAIFPGNDRDRLQDAESPEGHVLKISNGGTDNVQRAGHRISHPRPQKRSAAKTALLRKDHEFYAKIPARSPKFMEPICTWYLIGVRIGDEYGAEAAGSIDHRRWHRHRTCDQRSLSS